METVPGDKLLVLGELRTGDGFIAVGRLLALRELVVLGDKSSVHGKLVVCIIVALGELPFSKGLGFRPWTHALAETNHANLLRCKVCRGQYCFSEADAELRGDKYCSPDREARWLF